MDDVPPGTDLELYLLRHAHAGNPGEWHGDDAARPLSSKGRRQAERLGRFLAERGFVPDGIVSSPRVRARQTAEIVADALGQRVTLDGRLAGPLDEDELTRVLEACGGTSIVLVGHDPDFSDLAASLSGASYLPLRKGTLVRIDLSLPLRPGGGLLRWLVPPDFLADHY